jgi:hypothetical protein
MDHAYIDEADIVSRYLLSRLTPEDERAFEAHFVDCRRCLDRIEQEQQLREGLSIVAAEAAALRGGTAVNRAMTANASTRADAAMHGSAERAAGDTSAMHWRTILPLAASVLLCAALGVAVTQIGRLRGELARLQRDATIGPQTAALQPTIPQPAIPPPSAAVPVIALSLVRGLTSPGAPPIVQIARPSGASHVVLLIDLGDASFAAYRVTLTTLANADTILWRDERVVPTTPAELAVAVPATMVSPRDYAVQVDGISRNGRHASVGHYTFRVRS